MLLLFMLLLACFWPKRVQNAIFSLRVAEATHAYSDGAIAGLLAEDPDLAARRDAAAALLDKLDRARETLDDFAAARAFDVDAPAARG